MLNELEDARETVNKVCKLEIKKFDLFFRTKIN